LFGMSFEQEGIRLKPVVPAQLGVRGLVLNDLSYRQANLTIAIHGNGSLIRRFWLDGRSQPDAFIPGTLSGTHRVDVFLEAAKPRSNRTAVEVQRQRQSDSATR
jgi:hypothetical protein